MQIQILSLFLLSAISYSQNAWLSHRISNPTWPQSPYSPHDSGLILGLAAGESWRVLPEALLWSSYQTRWYGMKTYSQVQEWGNKNIVTYGIQPILRWNSLSFNCAWTWNDHENQSFLKSFGSASIQHQNPRYWIATHIEQMEGWRTGLTVNWGPSSTFQLGSSWIYAIADEVSSQHHSQWILWNSIPIASRWRLENSILTEPLSFSSSIKWNWKNWGLDAHGNWHHKLPWSRELGFLWSSQSNPLTQ
jgi:hypothetical protein